MTGSMSTSSSRSSSKSPKRSSRVAASTPLSNPHPTSPSLAQESGHTSKAVAASVTSSVSASVGPPSLGSYLQKSNGRSSIAGSSNNVGRSRRPAFDTGEEAGATATATGRRRRQSKQVHNHHHPHRQRSQKRRQPPQRRSSTGSTGGQAGRNGSSSHLTLGKFFQRAAQPSSSKPTSRLSQASSSTAGDTNTVTTAESGAIIHAPTDASLVSGITLDTNLLDEASCMSSNTHSNKQRSRTSHYANHSNNFNISSSNMTNNHQNHNSQGQMHYNLSHYINNTGSGNGIGGGGGGSSHHRRSDISDITESVANNSFQQQFFQNSFISGNVGNGEYGNDDDDDGTAAMEFFGTSSTISALQLESSTVSSSFFPSDGDFWGHSQQQQQQRNHIDTVVAMDVDGDNNNNNNIENNIIRDDGDTDTDTGSLLTEGQHRFESSFRSRRNSTGTRNSGSNTGVINNSNDDSNNNSNQAQVSKRRDSSNFMPGLPARAKSMELSEAFKLLKEEDEGSINAGAGAGASVTDNDNVMCSNNSTSSITLGSESWTMMTIDDGSNTPSSSNRTNKKSLSPHRMKKTKTNNNTANLRSNAMSLRANSSRKFVRRLSPFIESPDFTDSHRISDDDNDTTTRGGVDDDDDATKSEFDDSGVITMDTHSQVGGESRVARDDQEDDDSEADDDDQTRSFHSRHSNASSITMDDSFIGMISNGSSNFRRRHSAVANRSLSKSLHTPRRGLAGPGAGGFRSSGLPPTPPPPPPPPPADMKAQRFEPDTSPLPMRKRQIRPCALPVRQHSTTGGRKGRRNSTGNANGVDGTNPPFLDVSRESSRQQQQPPQAPQQQQQHRRKQKKNHPPMLPPSRRGKKSPTKQGSNVVPSSLSSQLPAPPTTTTTTTTISGNGVTGTGGVAIPPSAFSSPRMPRRQASGKNGVVLGVEVQ